jgi:hypothetical protein
MNNYSPPSALLYHELKEERTCIGDGRHMIAISVLGLSRLSASKIEIPRASTNELMVSANCLPRAVPSALSAATATYQMHRSGRQLGTRLT